MKKNGLTWRERRAVARKVKKMRGRRPDCPRCDSVISCKGCRKGNEDNR